VAGASGGLTTARGDECKVQVRVLFLNFGFLFCL